MPMAAALRLKVWVTERSSMENMCAQEIESGGSSLALAAAKDALLARQQVPSFV